MSKNASNSRELYADFLRAVCIFLVIIIHTTANYYFDSYGTSDFKRVLVISIITSSAVPLFYMLSGSFLINKKNDSYKTFYKKIVKIFLQTIIWTIIYLLIFKFALSREVNLKESIVKALFKEQVWHLWYMYPLIGLYILTPFIVKLYYSLNDVEKRILILLTFIFPALLCTLQIKYWDIISIPKFAIFFPEFGLFITGRYLYENRDKLKSIRALVFSFVGILLSVLGIYLLTMLFIKNHGINDAKQFLDANKIPNIILICSIYILFISLEKYFNKLPNIIKNIVSEIGKNSGGIYFSHMIFVELLPSISILGVKLTQNTGTLCNMLLGAVFYFVVTNILVLIIKRIPVLNKLI